MTATTASKPEVIYIHPASLPAAPDIIPMGVSGLMNLLECRKAGLYFHEVTEQHVKSARMLALDLHWFPSLTPVQRLAARYKEINSDIKIIAGGYTASIFADLLVKCSCIDYVVPGGFRPALSATGGTALGRG